MTNLTFAKYFRPGVTTLERLEREKERVQSCADRNAEYYASILKNIDEEITALRAQNGVVDVAPSETPQIALLARSEGKIESEAS